MVSAGGAVSKVIDSTLPAFDSTCSFHIDTLLGLKYPSHMSHTRATTGGELGLVFPITLLAKSPSNCCGVPSKSRESAADSVVAGVHIIHICTR